jgi:Tetratricopeptide repeat.
MEGVNHYNQGNYETAEYYFSKAVELDNKYQPAHCWLGVCYAICGQGNMALASLNNAIQIDPNTAEAQSARRRKAKLEKGITVGIGGFQNLTNFRQPYGEQPLSAALKSQLIKTGLYHVSDVGRNWTNNPRDACVRAKSQGVQILLQGIVSDIQLSSTPAFLENIFRECII